MYDLSVDNKQPYLMLITAARRKPSYILMTQRKSCCVERRPVLDLDFSGLALLAHDDADDDEADHRQTHSDHADGDEHLCGDGVWSVEEVRTGVWATDVQ